MRYILSLDQGTTSSRALLFDHEGRVRSVAQREFTQIFPRPGWVEHDPEEIAASQIAVALEALAQAQVQPSDVAAVGITNQRETAIVWDRTTGKPIYNAIVWQDRRTAAFCSDLKAQGHENLIQQRTGLLIDAYFSASKICWILDHVPNARQLADANQLAFGTVDAWLLWKLTGGRLHITDAVGRGPARFVEGLDRPPYMLGPRKAERLSDGHAEFADALLVVYDQQADT